MWRSRTLTDFWWECKMVELLWKTLGQFLKRLSIQLPYDPGVLLLGRYPTYV